MTLSHGSRKIGAGRIHRVVYVVCSPEKDGLDASTFCTRAGEETCLKAFLAQNKGPAELGAVAASSIFACDLLTESLPSTLEMKDSAPVRRQHI